MGFNSAFEGLRYVLQKFVEALSTNQEGEQRPKLRVCEVEATRTFAPEARSNREVNNVIILINN
jgi:hypothetical protein